MNAATFRAPSAVCKGLHPRGKTRWIAVSAESIFARCPELKHGCVDFCRQLRTSSQPGRRRAAQLLQRPVACSPGTSTTSGATAGGTRHRTRTRDAVAFLHRTDNEVHARPWQTLIATGFATSPIAGAAAEPRARLRVRANGRSFDWR